MRDFRAIVFVLLGTVDHGRHHGTVRRRVAAQGADRFYVLRWPELQRVLINGYRGYLKRHGGRRPRRADSFHTALREPDIKSFLDNWSLFDAFTEVSKTDPGTPGGPSAPH